MSSKTKLEFSSKEFVGLVERNKSKLITISLSLLVSAFAVSFILVALFPPAGAYGDPIVVGPPSIGPIPNIPTSVPMYMKTGMRAMTNRQMTEDVDPTNVVACTHCAVPPGKLIGFSMIGPALAVVIIIALVAVFLVKKKKLEDGVSGSGSGSKRAKDLVGGFFGDMPDADFVSY